MNGTIFATVLRNVKNRLMKSKCDTNCNINICHKISDIVILVILMFVVLVLILILTINKLKDTN